MRMQREEWSCGAAASVNALKHFGVHVQERNVIPIAGTIATSKCLHCKKVERLLDNRTCKKPSHWRCSCEECLEVKRSWRKECSAGTTEKGILAAVRYFGIDKGVSATEYESESKNDAWQWLHGSLLHGRVIILCIDSWSHWVLAFGSAGDRVSIFDSYPSKKNLKESGVSILSKSELMRRWRNGRRWAGKEKRIYAISVGKSK